MGFKVVYEGFGGYVGVILISSKIPLNWRSEALGSWTQLRAIREELGVRKSKGNLRKTKARPSRGSQYTSTLGCPRGTMHMSKRSFSTSPKIS